MTRTAVLLAAFALAACTGTIILGDNPGVPNPPADGGGATASNDETPFDSGADAERDAGGDAEAAHCHCASSEVCVASRTIGGVRLDPDDAGTCPAGRHVEADAVGTTCLSDWDYTCVTRPAACAAPTACSCQSTFCADHGFGSACSVDAGSTADVECVRQVP